MTVSMPSVPAQKQPHVYLRQPLPLQFPVEASVPETLRHFRLRTALYLSLRHELRGRATLATEQFLYWDPTDPNQNLAPDLAVRVGGPDLVIDVWKTWQLGAPHVVVEIVSDSDRAERRFEQKLEGYRRAGVLEVVRFEPEGRGAPLRLFDAFDGDLVERKLEAADARRCDALGLHWTLCPDAELGTSLRLARDAEGSDLVRTPEEAERADREIERARAEAERAGKEAALARIRELEAELARRG